MGLEISTQSSVHEICPIPANKELNEESTWHEVQNMMTSWPQTTILGIEGKLHWTFDSNMNVSLNPCHIKALYRFTDVRCSLAALFCSMDSGCILISSSPHLQDKPHPPSDYSGDNSALRIGGGRFL